MNAEDRKVLLTLPANADFVDIVRLNLYGIASKMGFSYEEIEDMKVAVSEACNNSVLYAYGQDDGVIEVTFEMKSDVLSIIIMDEGQGIDGCATPCDCESLHDKKLADVEIGGLGYYLMQALMDDVSVESRAGQGTQVILTKRIMRSEEAV